MLGRTVGNRLGALLKDHGFRRNKLVWIRISNRIHHLFELQPSRSNRGGQCDFRVNVGALSERVWTIYWNKPLPTDFGSIECYPWFRIGDILADFSPKSRDKWWTVSKVMAAEDLKSVESEVCDAVGKKCVPLLDQMQTEHDLLLWGGKMHPAYRNMPINRIYRAILHHLTGDAGSSEAVFRTLEKPQPDAWHNRVLDVKSRLEFADRYGSSE